MTGNQDQFYHQHISSQHRWLDLKLKEVWHYRDLIWLFTKRSFTVTYKQTILGPIWLILKPLLVSVMHVIVFGNIAKLSTDGLPQLLFYFTGTALWTYFSSCFTGNATVFNSNAHLFGKVYFPRLVVPIASLLSNAFCFLIQMIFVIILIIYYHTAGVIVPNWLTWLLIPLILLETGILALGCGLIVSSLTTKYRDLSILVTFGTTLWMYGTPVVYPFSQLSSGLLKTFICLNPMTAPMEAFRFLVLGKGSLNVCGMVYSVGAALILFLLGLIIFNKVERNFMDTI